MIKESRKLQNDQLFAVENKVSSNVMLTKVVSYYCER